MMWFEHASSRYKQWVKWFVMGSIAPDVIYYLMFIYLGVSEGFFNAELFYNAFILLMGERSEAIAHEWFSHLHLFFDVLFDHPVVVVLRQAGHSLFIWMFVFIIVWIRFGMKMTAFSAFLWGWLGHVLTDLLTHVDDAIPLFWPISSYIITGPVSYWNPQYYGKEFGLINNIFIFIAIMYLIFDKLRTRKRRRKEIN
jgi:hypothetical protein